MENTPRYGKYSEQNLFCSRSARKNANAERAAARLPTPVLLAARSFKARLVDLPDIGLRFFLADPRLRERLFTVYTSSNCYM